MSDKEHAHEILIIKRGGGHHDEHHGGVWKIAFADFMTAMMAFFLVMWLVSASDKTKAVVARYFNPIELVDSTPQPRGLDDSKKASTTEAKRPDAAPPEKTTEQPKPEANKPETALTDPPKAAAPRPFEVTPLDDADQSARHEETELIRDPYAVIAEIAEKKSIEPQKQSTAVRDPQKAAGGDGGAGLRKGEAFRDPFEPQPSPAGADVLAAVSPPAAPAPAVPAPAVPAAAVAVPPKPAPMPVAAASPAPQETAPAALAAKEQTDVADKPLSAAALRTKLTAIAKGADGNGAPTAGPGVEVRRTDEGTLVSLTDTADFSMFGSASARPSAQAVALMARIGKVLKAQKGLVTVRGFTDSRPFRSDVYDNWRLSTERAHIAQYMLVRGGFDEARIERIEGYADRHPKNAKDPQGAENRRIEILIRDSAP